MEQNKIIYTFWHDRHNMPAYIKLCIETWKKFLPEFNIVILSYDNLDEYIGKDFYDKFLFENFTIAQQTQAIRAAVLERHGGYWFDADIIVTSREFLNYFEDNSELNFFSNRIACIKANKGSRILKMWVKGIKWNVWKYKHFFNFIFNHFPDTASDMMNWDYLSGRILRRIYGCTNKRLLNNIDINDACTYLELCWAEENKEYKAPMMDLYNHFYIKNNFSDYALTKNKGLIILHNSWMPREYQTLTKEEILAKNNTLSHILKSVNA